MRVRIEWKGYDRQWAVVNNGCQVIRASFRTEELAEDWARENGYEVKK